MSRRTWFLAAAAGLALLGGLAWTVVRDRGPEDPGAAATALASRPPLPLPLVGGSYTPPVVPAAARDAAVLDPASATPEPPPRVHEAAAPSPSDPAARRARIAELATIIEGLGGYFGEHVGLGGETPEGWKAFAELKDLGTIEELTALVGHPSPAVRVYAFEALVERGAAVFALLQAHLDDLAELARMDGCRVSQEKVADIMLELAWDKLDPGPREILEDAILAGELPLAFKTRVLRDLGTPDSRYESVRRLAARGDGQAVVVLARYRRSSDVPLVLEAFRVEETRYAALEAMGEFPQPEYLPVLRDFQAGLAGAERFSNEWRVLYAALAAYGSPEVLPMLEKAFGEEPMRKYHLDFLLQALERHRIPLYEPLMRRLLAEARTTPAVLDYLIRDSERGIDDLLPGLLERAGAFDRQTLDRLLARVEALPDEPGRRAIRRRFLEHASVHHIELASRTVAETRDLEAIPILLRIAENESNPYMYLAAARGLLLYDQGWIDARLQTLLRDREARTDPGDPTGWGVEHLRKLIEVQPRVWKPSGGD